MSATSPRSGEPGILQFAGVAHPWRVALAVVLGLTILRVLLLFATDLQLYGDEAQYWSYGENLAFGYYSKPPMIAWLARLTTALGGAGEAWVRLSSPLLHAASALLLFAFARGLYDRQTALLVTVCYASLPAVSYGSLLLSTDTSLLAFWVLALLALWHLRTPETARGGWWVLLGLALGGGLLSKYAMGYLLIGLAVYAALSPSGRQLLRNPRVWLGLALGLIIFAPNVLWNLHHNGATMVHVAENANLGGRLWRPGEGLGFFAAQFGVVGPIFFAAFIARLALAGRYPLEDRERFLIAFSLPMLVIIQAQAFLAGANANWAATAVPAAVVLAIGWLLQLGRKAWLGVALAINAIAIIGLAVFAVWPGTITAVAGEKPLQDLRGWRAFAQAVEDRAAACGCRTIVLDHRFELAELWYYGDGDPGRLRMWVTNDISNHYELSRPYTQHVATPMLYVTERGDPSSVLEKLGPVTRQDDFAVPTGPRSERAYRAFVVAPVSSRSEDTAK